MRKNKVIMWSTQYTQMDPKRQNISTSQWLTRQINVAIIVAMICLTASASEWFLLAIFTLERTCYFYKAQFFRLNYKEVSFVELLF